MTAGESAAPAPLRQARNVGAYLAGRSLWISATQVINVAVGWTVYDLTRSAWALGLVGLAAFAPKLVLMLVSGWVADYFDRRRVAAVCLAVNTTACLALLVIAGRPEVPIAAIYAIFFVIGASRGFLGPATQALAASLVPRAELGRLVGLSSSIGQVAAIAGPALGGLLYVAGAWAPFACAAAFFASSAFMHLWIQLPHAIRTGGPPRLTDAFEGLAFIARRPVILGAISLDLFAVLLGGATALLPIIAIEILEAGPVTLGLMRAMPALGAAMIGLGLAWRPIRRRAGPMLFTATSVFGLATIGLGFSESLALSLAFLWVIGASDVVSVVIRQTMVQVDTPEDMRGRVAAVNSLFVGASNELGEFESGATAALLGLVPAIVLGGVGTIAVSLTWAWLFPGLRRRDYLVDPVA